MTEGPKVSVILPTAQHHIHYLPHAIDTLLNQTLRDFELIVVGDGTHGTMRTYLDGLADPRVTVMHDDSGPTEAVNAGIARARGRYLTFVSADNYSADYFLEALAAALDATPTAYVAYSPFYGVDGDGAVLGLQYNNLLLLRELVTASPRGNAGFMYRREVHGWHGPLEGWACDTALWVRILEKYEAVHVLEPTYFFRFHPDRVSVKRRDAVITDVRAITEEFFKRHRATIDPQFMTSLYPALRFDSATVGDLADACCDFAARMVGRGWLDAAVASLRLAMTAAPPDKLLRPLINVVATVAATGGDILGTVESGLATNRQISPEIHDAALDVTRSLAVLAGQAGSAPLWALEESSPLVRNEPKLLFSYCAWKSGIMTKPTVNLAQ